MLISTYNNRQIEYYDDLNCDDTMDFHPFDEDLAYWIVHINKQAKALATIHTGRPKKLEWIL